LELATFNLKPEMCEPKGVFCVVLHDASPVFASEITEYIGRISPLIGRCFGAAVVPHWHGLGSKKWPASFAGMLTEHTGELLVHGYTHKSRGDSLLAWLTDQSTEFESIGSEAIRKRLQLARTFIQSELGHEAHGVIAPAWHKGALQWSDIAAAGLSYQMSWRALSTAESAYPLATWSWDWGHWRCAGVCGGMLGAARALLQRATPCVALHPRDVPRGFACRGIAKIKALLDSGYAPLLPHEVFA
jgi:predicted deacetylase